MHFAAQGSKELHASFEAKLNSEFRNVRDQKWLYYKMLQISPCVERCNVKEQKRLESRPFPLESGIVTMLQFVWYTRPLTTRMTLQTCAAVGKTIQLASSCSRSD